ncbi:hypothetical protein ES703_72918 [subsurface metagenome]
MRSLGASVPITIGILLLIYIFTFGEIWNNHSVQSYMVFCTGVICLCLGFLGIALIDIKKQ